MVENLVKKGLSAFVAKQTNIFSAAFFIIVTTLFSQILGFISKHLLASIFGASHDLGVYFAAFRIPDFIFQILIAGAIASAFIPIFSEYISQEKKQEAFKFSSTIITLSLLVFCMLSIVIAIFAYPLCSLLAPGFSVAETQLMANLMRIILASQVFFILGLIVTSILQSFHHFLIPGIASSFYNFGIILGIIFLSPYLGIYGVCIGVLIGSMLFFVVQLPFLKTVDFQFAPILKINDSVKKLIHLMIPTSLMLLISQIGMSASVFFVSFISARSFVIFDFAQSLMAAPVLLFGRSIAQASFPSLSISHNNKNQFVSIFLSSFFQIVYLTLPISVLLIVLRIPIVRLLYGAGKFDWPATVDTGRTLAYFSISIAAQALIYLFSRTLYATKDTKTPFYVTLISVITYILMSYFFVLVYHLPIYAVAFAFSFGNILSAFLLLFFIDQKITLPKKEIIVTVSKIFLASLVMGVSLYIPIKLLDQLVFDTTRTINLLTLTGIASVAGVTSYIFFTWLLDIREALYIISIVKKLGDWRKILTQVDEPIDGSKLNP